MVRWKISTNKNTFDNRKLSSGTRNSDSMTSNNNYEVVTSFMNNHYGNDQCSNEKLQL